MVPAVMTIQAGHVVMEGDAVAEPEFGGLNSEI